MSTTPQDPFTSSDNNGGAPQPEAWGEPAPQVAAPMSDQSAPPAPFTQPQYAQPGYDQAQYQQGYPQPYGGPNPSQSKNWMGIVSLVASLSTFITGFGCIVGIVFGHLALSAVKKGEADNRGLALGGLIAGYVFVGIGVLIALFYVFFFVVMISSAP